MVGIEKAKTGSRPFGHGKPEIDLTCTFEGTHYKFTLLLPVLEKVVGEKKERSVFTDDDVDKLFDLFAKDFGGASVFESRSGAPSVRGNYLDKETGKPVTDWNIGIVIYAKRHDKAVEYFTVLKARLMQHVKDVRHMEQKEIVIEQAEVTFIPYRTLEVLRTERKERLKYLNR